jgi:osmotically-inducible protein OsmY
MTQFRRLARPMGVRTMGAAVLALSALVALPGCAPLLVGGAVVGGVLVATDRRTSGAVVEDQAIEIKAANRVRELATLGHVNATSYNRVVLLTGEVPDAGERERVEKALAGIENLRSIVNELAVAGNSSLTSRSNDTLLTTKVKASFVDAQDIFANAIKVVTERGTVYLLGRVSEREAERAASLASRVPGVQKVVRVFEILSEDEVKALQLTPQR